MFDKLVDEWLSNLKEKPDWLHVEACLVNNQNFQAPLEPQAATELLCSTWFHDFEASFSSYILFFIKIFFIKQEKSGKKLCGCRAKNVWHPR